ncbi:MAG: sigma 54-interacting transcriptional regulator [Fibrobacterota bacterium]
MASLIDIEKGDVFFLNRLTSLGGSGNDIAIDNVDGTVCLIHFIKENFSAEPAGDLKTFSINGRKTKKARLKEGDVLKISGQSFKFTHFSYPMEKGEAGFREIGRFLDEMHIFSSSLMQETDFNSLLDKLITSSFKLINAEKGFIVIKSENDEFRINNCLNFNETDFEDCHRISNEIVNKVAESKEGVVITDAFNNKEFNVTYSIVNLKIRSFIGVPIMCKNELLGVMYLASSKASAAFNGDDLRVLTVFASQAGLIIRNLFFIQDLRARNEQLMLKSGRIVYEDPKMRAIMKTVTKIAPSEISVLILGETGTGKELLAGEIHERSKRAKMPFITVNCSAIPENLLESELFGHKKGSFTGAVYDKTGKFEAADGGTVFLDEIGDMPPLAQTKILRVLENGEIEAVGDPVPRKINVRVIAATNRKVEEGCIREDLYYRLSGIEMSIPPLRERGNDSVIIARHMLRTFCSENNRNLIFTRDAERAILEYGWPGNVRELRNRVVRAATMAESGEVSCSNMEFSKEGEIIPLDKARDNFCRNYIERLLMLNDGDKKKTASELGIDVRTVYRYLEQ